MKIAIKGCGVCEIEKEGWGKGGEMRKGDWIQTYTGKKFYPLDPHPEDVDIKDIAHALSLTCRYNGHSRVFYSVAEHSIRMALEESFPGSEIWRLLHDSAEAYISDVPRPVKQMVPVFSEMESKILDAVKVRFGLPDFPGDEIHYADMVMLATEKRDILVPGGPEWGPMPDPLPLQIFPWSPRSPKQVETYFIELAQALID
jgi:hypothetical protein